MKKYIDFNTETRTNAANSFEKKKLKSMINSVCGKTMENLWKRINVRLANNENDFLKYTSRPALIPHKIFDKNYAAIFEIKPVLTLGKPIYVGFTVLELSKWLMYDFITLLKNILMLNLLFADTELKYLTYEIKSEDVYEEFFNHKYLFHFSNYPKDSKFLIRLIKKFSVSEEKMLYEFVGLKSKMYSMKSIDGKKSNTGKGVNIANEFNKFKDTLFNKKVGRHKMKRIQSKKHKIGTYEISKRSLSCFDDKRFALNDGIPMFAYFHKDIDSHKW